MKKRSLAATVGLFAVTVASPAAAEEGMWTFDNFPAEQLRASYGWAPDEAWLERTRLAAVRLTGGCSASFVSGEGLILTNHHCIASCLFDNSTAETDLLNTGFTAARRENEKLCPGQQAEVVTAISDVTQRVQAAYDGLEGEALTKARDGTIAEIEAEGCPDRETTRCQVVSLFGGGQYTSSHRAMLCQTVGVTR